MIQDKWFDKRINQMMLAAGAQRLNLRQFAEWTEDKYRATVFTATYFQPQRSSYSNVRIMTIIEVRHSALQLPRFAILPHDFALYCGHVVGYRRILHESGTDITPHHRMFGYGGTVEVISINRVRKLMTDVVCKFFTENDEFAVEGDNDSLVIYYPVAARGRNGQSFSEIKHKAAIADGLAIAELFLNEAPY